MNLTTKHYYEGRKLRRKLEGLAKKEAKSLVQSEESTDLDEARAIMSTYHWMKSKHIDSVIVEKRLIGGWVVLLTFADLPRGIPNVLGAPGKPKSEAEAMFEATRLLRAAFVKCEDTKKMMREGNFEENRLFRYQTLNLQVPGALVDSAARKVPELPGEKDAQKMRMTHIENMRKIIGPGELTGDRWDRMSEDQKLKLMIEASFLLCLNINIVA
ncbi:hypothetical protein [Pseudosulfitobacter pseudonitzschiae]|uniref:hypothetical protein n=1 Tax=Pseudosulfitobacter pseudonitzschiae TaxID=1402135 RepID=UPI003B80FFA0